MPPVKRLLAAAFALLTAGCGSTQVCSLVGCVGLAELRVHDLSPALRYPLTAHACFDERCADLTIGQLPPAAGSPMSMSCSGVARHACVDRRETQGYVGVAFDDPPHGGRLHTASVEVWDADGAVVIRSSQPLTLVKRAPNGEQCGPICWSGTADFR